MSAALLRVNEPLAVHVRCSCLRAYTLEEFRRRPLVGVQPLGGIHRATLRGCPCDSTLLGELERYDEDARGWVLVDFVE